MTMKVQSGLAIAFVLALGSTLAPAASAADRTVEEIPLKQSRPPAHLKQMPDGHWTAWDAAAVPEGAKVHMVAPGDTFWALAAQNLSNPYLWPQIWDQNRYVLDSHWIYPGDPIILPNVDVVPPDPSATAATGAQTMTQEDAEGDAAEDSDFEPAAAAPASPAAPARQTRYRMATYRDLHCAAMIEDEPAPNGMQVVGLEDPELLAVAQGDIVYINAGSSNGIAAGDKFSILRNGCKVKHPATHKPLGLRVDMVGELRIIAVTEKGATAEVTFSCENVRRGDVIAPLTDYQVPTADKPMPGSIDVYNPRSSGKASGYVVLIRDPIETVASGHLVDIDMGRSQGLKAGDVVSIFRPNPEGHELPRVNLGLGVVLITAEHSSVMRISTTAKEMFLGDQVEMR
jgi:hypothetical protein